MAVKSMDGWSAQIRSALATIDPTISTEVGDPIRKLIDAVSSVAAAIDINGQVNQSFFDIDSKSGTDLDAIASWLGFGRRQGTVSVGEIRFYIDNPASVAIDIPSGTQVTDGNVTFETVSATVIDQFQTEVTARIRCTTVGISGNVNAYEINQVITTFQSVSMKCENPYNTTGGTETETDAQLRKRIRQTFLRNVAGTEDAYRGIVDRVRGVTKVNVVGPVERWEEQLEVVNLNEDDGGGVGVRSMIDCSKFTWPRQSYLVREPGTENEKVYVQGVDYTLDTSRQPPVARINMTPEEMNIDKLTGSDLDKIGEAFNLARDTGAPASGTVSFGFDVAQGSNYVIKSGTRIKSRSDGAIYTTMADTTIYSGNLGSTSVPVQSVEYKDVTVASGEFMDLVDRTGFRVECSQEISGGRPAWSDDYYRQQLILRFGELINIKVGDFLFMRHEYCSVDSRNEPSQNPPKVNKVDVFMDGIDSQSIRECAQIRTHQLTTDAEDDFNVNDWYWEDNTHPANGTKVQILGYAPVLRLPDSFNVNGSIYRKDRQYRLIKRMVLTRGSEREVGAIGWIAGASVPADGSFLDITYDFNRTPIVCDQLIETNRQITTDVLVHEAHQVGLVVNLIVQNVLGVSDDQLLSQVNGYLDQYADSLEFGSWVQFSDIEMYVRQAMGVDACRIARKSDAKRVITIGEDVGQEIGSGIQTVETYRRDLPAQHDEDFRLRDSHLAYISKVRIVREASNTYGEGDQSGHVTDVQSLTLDRNTVTVEGDQTQTVIATVTPSTWDGNLTVSTNGGGVTAVPTKTDPTHWSIVIMGGGVRGTFTVTVVAGTKRAYVTVNVTAPASTVDTITLAPSSVQAETGKTFVLKCTVTPSTWSHDPVMSTSNPQAVSVGVPVRAGDGIWNITCTALSPVERTTVSATAGGKTATSNIQVTGSPVTPPDDPKNASTGIPIYAVASSDASSSSQGQTIKRPSLLMITGADPGIVYDDGGSVTSAAKAETDGLPMFVVNSASDTRSIHGQTIHRPCILTVIGSDVPEMIYDDGNGAAAPSSWYGIPTFVVRDASDRTSVHGQPVTGPCILIVHGGDQDSIIYWDGK